MASSAFRSSARRSSAIGAAPDSSSTSSSSSSSAANHHNHRRSRSLSRAPSQLDRDEFAPAPTPRRKFVNTERGSGFPEISLDDLSLDDLANEFFPVKDWEDDLERARASGGGGGGRGGRRSSDVGFAMETESSKRRGRSVSRKGGGVGESDGASVGVGDAGVGRRRRSLSVARNRSRGPEHGDFDYSNSIAHQTKRGADISKSQRQHVLQRPTTSTHALKRSSSNKDFLLSQDSYSSQHPTVDKEGNGLYEAVRMEVRNAVEEMRIELEKVMVNTKPFTTNGDGDFQAESSEVIRSIAEIKRSYTTKLEESEKRKQELLAELAAEEFRGQELSKIIKKLLPEQKQSAKVEKPSRGRRRSSDKTKISRCLSEEAGKYFENFISNVEDTDFSSFDEKSETSSTVGHSTKTKEQTVHSAMVETQEFSARQASTPVDTDGLVLPWLQWETNGGSSPSSKSKIPLKSEKNLNGAAQEGNSCHGNSDVPSRSHGSWSPSCNGDSAMSKYKKDDQSEEARRYSGNYPVGRESKSLFDLQADDKKQSRVEDLLLETFRQRSRIDSGGLVLCRRIFFGSYSY